MKSVIFCLLSFLVLAATAASIGKLNGVSGNVKIIEFDVKSDAFIVSKEKNGDRLYKLDSQNQVIFKKDFVSVVDIKFNSKNDAYIFDRVDYTTRYVWVLSSNSIDISNVFNYSAGVDLPAFFDYSDHLFLDTSSGIAVVRNGTNVVDPIPRLAEFHLISKSAYDYHTNGNDFLVVSGGLITVVKSLMLQKAEILSPDPRPHYFNIQRFGNIRAQKLFNDSAYFCQDSIVRYKNGNVVIIDQGSKPAFCDFYVANNRIFVIYSDNEYVCSVAEITEYDTLADTGIKWANLEKSCDSYQTFDKYGTVFFGSSDDGSMIYYTKTNDHTKQINFLNSLFIFGLATTNNGSLWILSQALYLVPFGQTQAVIVNGLPWVARPGPFKTKPGTNDVFIGTDIGVFIGTLELNSDNY